MNRPLVLLHGLWDTPRLFGRLETELLRRRPALELYAPHLPHHLGAVPICELATQLAALIEARFGAGEPPPTVAADLSVLVRRIALSTRPRR